MTLENGTEIYYRGDIENQPAKGEIRCSYTDRWGSFYDIDLEDGREIRGIAVHMVYKWDSGNGSTRLVTMEAYQARRQALFEAAQRR